MLHMLCDNCHKELPITSSPKEWINVSVPVLTIFDGKPVITYVKETHFCKAACLKEWINNDKLHS
jgi:hypothetical protein